MQIRFNVLPTLIVVAASLGCTTSVKQYGIGFSDPNDPDIIYFDSIRNAQDRLSLLSTLDRAVPNGTPISRAEKLMADAGFQCKHYSSASFNETADSSGIDGRYRFVDPQIIFFAHFQQRARHLRNTPGPSHSCMMVDGASAIFWSEAMVSNIYRSRQNQAMHLSREMRRFEMEDLSSRRGDRQRSDLQAYFTYQLVLARAHR